MTIMDYSKSKIYKVLSPSHPNDGVYIGSTTQSLEQRFRQHRCDFGKNRYSCKSLSLFEYDDVSIELIEEYPCETKEELCLQEQKILDEIRGSGVSVLNHNNPIKRDNKVYHKRHREKNREKRRLYMIEYHKRKKQERIDAEQERQRVPS